MGSGMCRRGRVETDPAARVKMLNSAQMIALEEAAGMPFVGLFAMQIASPKVDMGYPGGDPCPLYTSDAADE